MGGISLSINVSRFHSQGKGCYISLGNELNFLISRSKAKNKNAPEEYIRNRQLLRTWIPLMTRYYFRRLSDLLILDSLRANGKDNQKSSESRALEPIFVENYVIVF